jgi:ATP-binding protein involved in chromosome partitioning
LKKENKGLESYFEEQAKISKRMGKIKYKIAIISGKGGVGKSTVTASLAIALVKKKYTIGVLDADIHGPSIPKMLGIRDQKLHGTPERGVIPPTDPLGIKVISMDFLLDDELPVIWRGPLKMKVISQFLYDIDWGEIDFLLVDLPPGTGDEPLTIMRRIPNIKGVVIVTIPSEVSQLVVKKAITFARELKVPIIGTFARELKVPIIGIIENMSGFICPKCGEKTNIFKAGGGEKLAEVMGVPFLGSIPIDPNITKDNDEGISFITKHSASEATKAFKQISNKVLRFSLQGISKKA